MTNIEVHNQSDFILFLRKNEIKLTSEIRLLYNMAHWQKCFVCLHEQEYFKESNYYESYIKLKDHFIQKHTTNYEGNYMKKGSAYGISMSDMHDHYSKTEYLVWDNNIILGLIDQMIVLESYLDRTRPKKDIQKKFNFFRGLGSTIIKIMKDYQIPQLIFTKYIGISGQSLERYTTTYYMSLPDNDKPKWMRSFLK